MEVLIANIKADQQMLIEKNKVLDEAKEEQRLISSRLKEYRKDVTHIWKYMSDEQKETIESLGLDIKEKSGDHGALNPISQVVLDALMGAKGNTMTNGEIYNYYIDSVGDGEPESYSRFNVKIRQLFSRGSISKEQIDPNKSGRDDIITLLIDSSEK